MATAETVAPSRRLAELTLDFLAYLELERGLSRNTLEAYRSDLQQFGLFLERLGRDPLEVQSVDLLEFVSELAVGRESKPPVAAATLQRKIACLRSFYRHLRREQILDRDPTTQLRPPRSRGRLPRGPGIAALPFSRSRQPRRFCRRLVVGLSRLPAGNANGDGHARPGTRRARGRDTACGDSARDPLRQRQRRASWAWDA